MFSCSGPQEKTVVDVSHISIDSIRIERFDRAMDSLHAENAGMLHQEWKESYGFFYRDYIENILKIGAVDDDASISLILGEIAGMKDFQELLDTVKHVFPDLSAQEAALTDVFKRVRFYFPDINMPGHIVAYFSGFAVQVPVGENYIGIGLDLFLGAGSEYYPPLTGTFPRYISRRFSPENIVPRVTEAYIREQLLPTEPLEASFLDNMLHHGKALYLMDLFLPASADSLKIGYTDRQQAWAVHFQKSVWDWMIDEELLFRTDHSLKQRHFGEAPFTPELGDRNDSAPKLGVFIGWQMVRQYMKRFPETTIAELLSMTDGQQFLHASAYRGDYQIL